jgi:hypothetical protein
VHFSRAGQHENHKQLKFSTIYENDKDANDYEEALIVGICFLAERKTITCGWCQQPKNFHLIACKWSNET